MSDEQTAGVELDAEFDASVGEARELDSGLEHADEPEDRSSSDHEHHTTTAKDPAPQCAGCHRRGIELTLLENGKRYCERCAREVERLMGIGPLFPGAEGAIGAGRSADSRRSKEGSAKESPTKPRGTRVQASVATERPRPAPQLEQTNHQSTQPAEEPAEELTDEATQAEGQTDIAADVARANQEAVESAANRLITKPTTTSDEDAAEERQPMERVQEQPQPTRLEAPPASAVAAASAASPPPADLAAAPAASPPPADLAAVLAAEQTRLHEERAAIETRFRADLDAIDQRLVHVESLLGKGPDSLAS